MFIIIDLLSLALVHVNLVKVDFIPFKTANPIIKMEEKATPWILLQTIND